MMKMAFGCKAHFRQSCWNHFVEVSCNPQFGIHKQFQIKTKPKLKREIITKISNLQNNEQVVAEANIFQYVANCNFCLPAGDIIERYRLLGNIGFCLREKVASLQWVFCIPFV